MAERSDPDGSIDNTVWQEIEKAFEEDSDMETSPVGSVDPPRSSKDTADTGINTPEIPHCKPMEEPATTEMEIEPTDVTKQECNLSVEEDSKTETSPVGSVDPSKSSDDTVDINIPNISECKHTEEPTTKIKVEHSKSPVAKESVTKQESDSSSEDELPLTTIQSRIRNKCKKIVDVEFDEDSDDSMKDPTFSITEEMRKSRKSKRRCTVTVRDKGWKKKPTLLNNICQWDTVVRMARKRNPYIVVPIKHGDILNFKPATQYILPATSAGVNEKKVQWMKIVWMQVRKRNDSLLFKCSFDQPEFHETKVRKARRGSVSIENGMPKCYADKLPVVDAKKKDLMSLCKSNIIPKEFHSFYENMPSNSSAVDCLSSPDMEENEMDSDED